MKNIMMAFFLAITFGTFSRASAYDLTWLDLQLSQRRLCAMPPEQISSFNHLAQRLRNEEPGVRFTTSRRVSHRVANLLTDGKLACYVMVSLFDKTSCINLDCDLSERW